MDVGLVGVGAAQPASNPPTSTHKPKSLTSTNVAEIRRRESIASSLSSIAVLHLSTCHRYRFSSGNLLKPDTDGKLYHCPHHLAVRWRRQTQIPIVPDGLVDARSSTEVSRPALPAGRNMVNVDCHDLLLSLCINPSLNVAHLHFTGTKIIETGAGENPAIRRDVEHCLSGLTAIVLSVPVSCSIEMPPEKSIGQLLSGKSDLLVSVSKLAPILTGECLHRVFRLERIHDKLPLCEFLAYWLTASRGECANTHLGIPQAWRANQGTRANRISINMRRNAGP